MAKWPETKKDDGECRLFEDVNVLKTPNFRLVDPMQCTGGVDMNSGKTIHSIKQNLNFAVVCI